MDQRLLICICSLLFGIVGSVAILSSHYNDQYTELRREIIQKTGTDITYPDGGCKMNDTFFMGKINTKTCVEVEVEEVPEEAIKITM